MLKSKFLALAILAVSSASFAGPITTEAAKPRTEPSGLRTAVEVNPAARTALGGENFKAAGVDAELATKVAEAGVEWKAREVQSMERMTREQADLFKITTANALTTINSAKASGTAHTAEGKKIIDAALQVLQLAPTTFSAKFKTVSEQIKVEIDQATVFTNAGIADGLNKVAAIESALGTSITEFANCQ